MAKEKPDGRGGQRSRGHTVASALGPLRPCPGGLTSEVRIGPQPGRTAHPPGPRARTAPSMQGAHDGGWRSARRDWRSSGETMGSACSRCSQDPNLPEPGAPPDASEEGRGNQHSASKIRQSQSGGGAQDPPELSLHWQRDSKAPGRPRICSEPAESRTCRPPIFRGITAQVSQKSPMAPGLTAPAIIKELTVCRGDSGRTIQALPSELPLVGKHTFHEQTQVNPLSQVREREAGRGS